MPRIAGQIDVHKTEAILDAASEVIAERGLAAPIEEIARRAGVSKQTVYNHYGAKTELVRALVERRVETVTAPLRNPGAHENPETALAEYAGTLLRVVGAKTYSLMRVIIQSAGEMPDLAHTMFASGPRRSREQLAAFLELEAKAGRLAIDDPFQAAEFFAGMVLGHRQTAHLLGVGETLEEDEVDRIAREAAARFMRAYAP